MRSIASPASLFVALVSVLVGDTVGLLWGVASGFHGGRFDLMSQRILDTLLSFPGGGLIDVAAANNPKLFALLKKALIETNLTKRAALYRQANNMIMNFLPGVPYVHTKPALAFQKRVTGYIPSPVSLEPFAPVNITGT